MEYIPEIYISYAWENQADGSNWPPILKNLHSTLIEKGYRVQIDIKSLKYKDNIRSFMQQLGQGKYIICIISEKYMKSLNCMYEVLQMLKFPNYQDRIFPVLMEDAKIYDSGKILEYLIHWDQKIQTLNNETRSLSNIVYATPILEDIEIMNEIRRALAKFGDEIGCMNVLTPNQHKNSNFSDLLTSIESKIELDKNEINLAVENSLLKQEIIELKSELENIKLKISNSNILEVPILESTLPTTNTKIIPSKNISDFENFIGLNKDSHISEAYKILGKPEEVSIHEKYIFNTAYFGDKGDISYFKENELIMTITINSSKNEFEADKKYFKKLGIIDDKIDFLGQHKDEIIKTFGEPDSDDSNNYTYSFQNILVRFICYDIDEFRCTSIYVHYLNPYMFFI